MIKISLQFYANLQDIFGKEIILKKENPISIFHVLEEFIDKEGNKAIKFFLEPNFSSLKDEYLIMVDGINIEGKNGLLTAISSDSEISFFPKFAGG